MDGVTKRKRSKNSATLTGLGVSLVVHGIMACLVLAAPQWYTAPARVIPLEFVAEKPETSYAPPPVVSRRENAVIKEEEKTTEKTTASVPAPAPVVPVAPSPPPDKTAAPTAVAPTPAATVAASTNKEVEKGGAAVHTGRVSGIAHAAPAPSVVETRFGADGAPTFVHRELPVYPPLARRLGREGKVTLKLYIDAQGRLRDIGVVESTWSLFTEAAKEALWKSTFAPARVNGRAMESRALLTVRFQLD
ncbi:MAG: TonB family protein [Syntrophales bacterium]|nr:TonB family protein [Syntrophales bacterium]